MSLYSTICFILIYKFESAVFRNMLYNKPNLFLYEYRKIIIQFVNIKELYENTHLTDHNHISNCVAIEARTLVYT